ncbi:MAG: hypothetical protein LBV29_00545, partial [Azoarcus sp.]|nr:hypothetical protein [Azoarcus sp.]
MAKKTDKPRLIVKDSDGKSSKFAVSQFEVDFGGDRRLLFLLSETGGCDLEIEAIAASDESAPVISVQPCASNVICLRVELPNDSPVDAGEITVVTEPV